MLATSATPFDTPSGRRLLKRGRLITFALLVAAAATWHAVAADLYSRSFQYSAPLASRQSAAAWAGRLEPWNARFTVRAAVMSGWMEGKRALDAGDYLTAVDSLAAAYRRDVGDPELLAIFKDAQKSLSLATTGIAHVQHGLDPSLTPSPAKP